MGGASPYRARFIGLPNGQPSRDSEGVPLGDNGEKYFGLVNLSNTCYVNSVVQALYFCLPFRKAAIRHLSEDKEDDSTGDSLLNSLCELFAQIDSQKRSVGCITPRRFLSRLRKANDLFCNAEHQDAHEFMQFLLNDIAENLKARALRQRKRDQQRLQSQQPQTAQQGLLPDDDEQVEDEPRTWIHDIFQGYLVNQMKCLCCENVTVRRETFLDLSVDIERHTSIAACLRAFESTELLRSGNKFFCDMCGCLQEAEKRLRIYQLPSVLMLHLKRFKYMERLGRSCRLPYRVVFPLQLRVVEHRPPRRHAAAGTPGYDAGGVSMDAPIGPDGEELAQAPSRLFELRAVVVHIGRDSSRGHYVAIVRSGDRFVLLDDDVVRVVEPEVLRSFYGTAGSAFPGGSSGGGSSGSGHERHSNHHSGSAGWGGHESGEHGNSRSGSSDRYPSHSQSTPLYERAPEGTCCGYLLMYEAVDGAPEHEAGQVLDVHSLDVGSAADWISEDRNLTDSDSDSGEEQPGAVPERPQINTTDDSEVTQAFEQRCIPRGPASRNQQYAAGSPHAAAPAAAAGLAGGSQDPRNRGLAPNSGVGHGGAFAWTAADDEGGRAPASNGNYGAHGVRTLGSVVPAVGSAEAVSPSRVNVVTMPSPAGTEETDGG